jgi:peptidyl-tRNA hydrolase, PTH1 family
MPEWVIAGLGNPGPEYHHTRHNLGYMLLDYWTQKLEVSFRPDKAFKGDVCQGEVAGKKCLFVKPTTFMNASGRSLRAIGAFFKLKPEKFLVAYDEYQLPFGECRLSVQGGPGGHNGIADILQHFGNNFVRLRLGIAPEEQRREDMKDYVLGKLRDDEKLKFEKARDTFIEAARRVVEQGPLLAMNSVNQRKKKQNP